MEKYEPLEMEIIEFDEEDIITASGQDGDMTWTQAGYQKQGILKA